MNRLPCCVYRIVLTIGITSAAAGGCATVGPAIDRGKLRAAHDYYEVKAKRHAYQQAIRVRTVGERLLGAVPQEKRPKRPPAFAGLLLDDLTFASARAFAIPDLSETIRTGPLQSDQEKGKQRKRSQRRQRSALSEKNACVIVGVLPKSPAAKVGLRAGDLLCKVDHRSTPNARKAAAAFRRMKPGTEALLLLEREGVRIEKPLTLAEKPYPVHFHVSDSEEVNAFAAPGGISVTSGLLRFVASDDELAVVVGHELAHLTEGHYAKRMGTEVVVGTLGILAGIGMDIIVPGAGGVISRVTAAGLRAPFSQNLEREADYVGLRYVHEAGFDMEAGIGFWDRFATELPQSLSRSLFNTHPTSPERLLRLKETLREIKSTPGAPRPADGLTGPGGR